MIGLENTSSDVPSSKSRSNALLTNKVTTSNPSRVKEVMKLAIARTLARAGVRLLLHTQATHVSVDGEWIVTAEQRQPDEQSPAGGVSSSANDVARWMARVLGEGTVDGQEVIPADALRKQVFLAHSDCDITAIFPTEAGTVEQAENEATGEAENLLSRREGNPNILQSRSPQCLTQ